MTAVVRELYFPLFFLKKNRIKSQNYGSLGRESRKEIIVNKREKGHLLLRLEQY